ncbi:MAG: hypothetical protein ACOC4M_16985, partial [Promethearchaeia archaeon]
RQISVDELIPDWITGKTAKENLLKYSKKLKPRHKTAKIYSDLITVRNAWEKLCELDKVLEIQEVCVDEMKTIIDLFEEAEREMLSDLYSKIEQSFNEYYTKIHPDEQEINLDFEAKRTESVELEAGFGEKRDSPLAFHSEGHIDTMGICLFLALRDQLNPQGPNIVMLDDVIMSIDRNHRRNVARLLSDYLDENIQGIISTHEEVWTDQLKEHDVVAPSNEFNIRDWDLSVGPILKGGSNNPIWDVIEEYIDDNKPHAAAAYLRRQAEKIGRAAASNLKAPIPFKDKYTLADYINGVNGRISNIASGAKGYHDQGNEIWEEAKELDDERSQLLSDYRVDELNSMIHYNQDEWGQLSPTDLEDVVTHWRKIEDLLFCENCQSMIKYKKDDDWKWIYCNCRNIEFGYEN